MSSKLASFFGSCSHADLGIEASFARGRELNKLVEIEEMNEKVKKESLEVKFKDEEDNGEGTSQSHVEMDILLGVLEEKKVSPGPSSAILVTGGSSGAGVHLRESSENPNVKGRKGKRGMDDQQFAEWRKQFRKPRQARDMHNRKRSAADEPEQSTADGNKRPKLEEF
jgi:hypothetical protein